MSIRIDGACKGCHSGHRRLFNSEIAIHFPGLEGLKKSIVWAFPELLICLDCGFTELKVSEKELRVLSEGFAADDAIIFDEEQRHVTNNHPVDQTNGSFGGHESSTVARNGHGKSLPDELLLPQDDVERGQ